MIYTKGENVEADEGMKWIKVWKPGGEGAVLT
jgi:hypothetical protein